MSQTNFRTYLSRLKSSSKTNKKSEKSEEKSQQSKSLEKSIPKNEEKCQPYLSRKSSKSMFYSRNSKLKRSVTFDNETVVSTNHKIERQLTPFIHNYKSMKRELEEDNDEIPLKRTLFSIDKENIYINNEIDRKIKDSCEKNRKKIEEKNDELSNLISKIIEGKKSNLSPGLSKIKKELNINKKIL